MVAVNMVHRLVNVGDSMDSIKGVAMLFAVLCVISFIGKAITPKPDLSIPITTDIDKRIVGDSFHVIHIPRTKLPEIEPPATETSNFHIDTQYKYNYRTGYTGNYTYNYDVESTTNGITGNCSMSGKFGNCTITNLDDESLSANAEWVDYGVMEVTDENGDVYEMEVQ